MTYELRRWLAQGLIGCLLFLQLAVAAHACTVGLSMPTRSTIDISPLSATDRPRLDESASSGTTGGESQPCFTASDEASPNLCNEHCKRGQQGDKAASPVVPAAWLTARYVIAAPVDIAARRRPVADSADALVAGQPPHAIAHCVLRT